ncbi:cytochrome c [Limibaculum sp. FT325]|uniref:c-type cytochrome n=1 Tax=Thermohalobaculum sediminis TaxID=2939436 RepID=UPI0020BDE301|nr:c-type cytochrome [Limibaculum sediminis]MCL5776099.1 cytochrome c [Limibaculum sediminis]
MKAGVHAIFCSLAIATPCLAEQAAPPAGAEDYIEHCAVCHGERATGDGPLSWLLKVAPPDLTTLAKRNGGTFPFEHAYRVIDGRVEVAAHGTRAMPVWGSRFKSEAQHATDPQRRPLAAEDVVTDRILTLIRYLERVQK